MSFFNYKNLLIKLNDNLLVVSDIQINEETSISPKYLSEERHSFDYAADSAINGNIKLTYLLTGNDFVRNFIADDTIISGNFGGLYFNSGYLKSYSINGSPNTPVNVNAEIVFFGPLSGQFNSSAPYNFTGHALNFSDSTLTTNARGCESLGNIVSCNYNYQSVIEPNFYQEDRVNLSTIRPNDVRYGTKQITLDVVCDNMSGDLPLEGSNAFIQINLNHPYITNITDTISLSGKLFRKNISTSSNNIIKNNISLRQDYVEPTPTITSIVPSTQLAGSNVTINGTNLTPTIYTYFGSDKADIVSSVSTALTVRVPYNAISSNVYVKTYGGRVSGGYFSVTYPPISIYRVDPITGREGDNILISGTNFYRINKVRFGSGQDAYNSNFMSINSGIINAKVPYSGIWDQIHVISDDRNKTGVSPWKFSPFPRIDSTPIQTGRSGSLYVVQGYNFSGVTGASFNGIYATGLGGNNVSIVGNTGLYCYIPSGGTRDSIRVFGPSGVNSYGQTKFQPVLFITGTLPLNGNKGALFRMSGTNFMPSIMSSGLPVSAASDLRGLKASFNGGITGLELINTATATAQAGILLQGFIPQDAKSGPIYIYQEDGAAVYNSTGSFTLINDSPVIQKRLSEQSAIFPQTVISGQTINSYILGKNFFNISRVVLSGSGQNNKFFANTTNNYTIDIPTANWSVDFLGTVINIQNYSTVGLYSGQYNIFVSGSQGTGKATGIDAPFIISSGLPWNNPDVSSLINIKA